MNAPRSGGGGRSRGPFQDTTTRSSRPKIPAAKAMTSIAIPLMWGVSRPRAVENGAYPALSPSLPGGGGLIRRKIPTNSNVTPTVTNSAKSSKTAMAAT